MTSSFTEDLKRGHTGELKFFSLFNNKLEHIDGRIADFKIISSGELVELKSDWYDLEKTENFFIERYSYENEPGGPFQALENRIKYYVYFFPRNDQFFIFETEDLCDYLSWRMKEEDLINIKNENYVTRGWKIPREQLAHLLVSPGVFS